MGIVTKTTKRAAVVPAFTAGRLFWPLAAWRVGRAVHDHWQARLAPRQRRQLLQLVVKSHGRPSNLPRRERRQLHRLVDTLGPFDLARVAAVAALPVAATSKRRLLPRR